MSRLLSDDSVDDCQLYVAAAICRPGKHSYMVKYLDTEQAEKSLGLNV